jgi:hypothetical protein
LLLLLDDFLQGFLGVFLHEEAVKEVFVSEQEVEVIVKLQ